MDERKKTIQDLEAKKQADTEGINRLLEGLGETLLARLETAEAAAGDPALLQEEYRRLMKHIADDEDIIRSIEADARRLQELSDALSRGDRQKTEQTKELSALYAELGQRLLADPALDTGGDLLTLYRNQRDDALQRMTSQEEKLDELGQKTGNVFTWVGKNVQSLAAKALMTKIESDLSRIYRAAGEQFLLAGADYEAAAEETRELAGRTAALRQAQAALTEELAALREDRRQLADALGNPARRIQGIERQIAHSREEIRDCCRRFGALTREEAFTPYFTPLLTGEDIVVGEKIAALVEAVAETEGKITRLRAAIAIDEEKAVIEKLQAAVETQREKIAAAEKTIAALERQIAEARQHVSELSRLV